MYHYQTFLATSFVLLLIARAVLVVLHELCHAVVALILVDSRVRVHIGSYRAHNGIRVLRINRLSISIIANPLLWKRGYYVVDSREPLSPGKHIAIILAGSLVPFVIGLLAFYLAFAMDSYDTLQLFFFIFGCVSVVGLLNLMPQQQPVYQRRGEALYNDGYQAASILRKRKYHGQWRAAIECYKGQRYDEAAQFFEDILKIAQHEDVRRLAISAHLLGYDFQKAYDLNEQWGDSCPMNSNDFATSGLIKSRLGCYEDALADYQQSLEYDNDNSHALNNRAYTLSLIGEFFVAIEDFNRAIEVDPDSAYAYSNRGLAKMKIGMIAEGLADIYHSLELDESNPYAYRNLGIYRLDRGEFASALGFFERAQEYDAHTHLVSDYINLAKQGIASARDSGSPIA